MSTKIQFKILAPILAQWFTCEMTMVVIEKNVNFETFTVSLKQLQLLLETINASKEDKNTSIFI